MLNPLETYRCNHCGKAGRPRFSVALLLIAAVLIALAIAFSWGALHLPMSGFSSSRRSAGAFESALFAVLFSLGAWHLLRQSKQHCRHCGFDFK